MAENLFGGIPAMLTSGFFWFAVLGIIVIVGIGSLYVRKRLRLQYPAYVLADVGSKKAGIESTKAGWFKNKTFFFGLWDYGSETYLYTADGRKVQGGSSGDFHEINGKRGLLLKRKDDDPKILIPIPEVEMDKASKALILSIAPADYRDASVQLIRQAENETKGKWEQIIQWILFGGLVIAYLVTMIVMSQAHTKALDNVIHYQCNAGTRVTTGGSP
jgi:hypothetical protein